MPLREQQNQYHETQNNWSGGMNCVEPGQNQYLWGKNIAIRDGYPTTRPGIRRAFRNWGYREGFYFNEDDARDNEPGHTGFWFDFQFHGQLWSGIQGVAVIRLPTDTIDKLLVVQGGAVFVNEAGVCSQVACAESIAADEEITFTQALDQVLMWRGENLPPLVWDGTSTGFTLVPAAAVSSDCPYAAAAVYQAGRLWASRARSVLGASDVFDFTEWDLTASTFAITPGDGDEITALVPWNDDKLLVFKRSSVSLLVGIQAADLSTGMSRVSADRVHGAVGRNAVVTYGEQVAYVGYGGIYNLQRSVENTALGVDLPLSWPIQTFVGRINWAVPTAAAGIQAAAWANYLLFAVPLDNATDNNAVLVYDRLAANGQGAWCGLWQGEQFRVRQWLPMNDKLYFLDYSGIVKQMFVDSPWDSDLPYDDTLVYSATRQYWPGDQCSYGAARIYQALVPTKGNLPTDADYWSEVTDPVGNQAIVSEIITRQYGRQDPSEKRWGKCEITFAHQAPSVSLAMMNEDYGSEETVFADQTYPADERDTCDGDWDDSNSQLDGNDPGRKDYTWYIPATGTLYIGDDGILLNSWAFHSLAFMRSLVRNRSFAVRLTNSAGRLSLRSLAMAAGLKRHATHRR